MQQHEMLNQCARIENLKRAMALEQKLWDTVQTLPHQGRGEDFWPPISAITYTLAYPLRLLYLPPPPKKNKIKNKN